MLPPAEVASARETAARLIARGTVFAWRVEGRPVSITGYQVTAPDGAGGRVNLVFTPPEERGKGYASACVAQLSQRLLDGGWAYCLIFADQANPVSNAIYRRLGYVEIAKLRMFAFAKPG